MTPEQVSQYIRFSLGQLRSRNAHHEFETLCRQFTRNRICSNILPATGPVSSGGDQGRDFETFHTYLTGQDGLTSFIALATEETIVFTCTLQQQGIGAKIKHDVHSITSQGTPVNRIYAFCEVDVPVATRHDIQQDVMAEYEVQLDILDGTSLAEHLADPEIFWIAQRYLDIPAEILPEIPAGERPQWYRNMLNKWQLLEQPWPPTYGTFSELKQGLRHATSGPDLSIDLVSWMNCMETFESAVTSLSLQRSASYEIVVASLRGLKTLDGQTERISAYLSDIASLSDTSEIQDAQVLVMYLAGRASVIGALNLEPECVMGWRNKLLDRVLELLQAYDHVGDRCVLLQTLGALYLVPNIAEPDDLITRDSIESALTAWSQLVELIPEAPLFPIDAIAEIVSIGSVLLAVGVCGTVVMVPIGQ